MKRILCCSVVLERSNNISKWIFYDRRGCGSFQGSKWVVFTSQVFSRDPTWSRDKTRRTARFRCWFGSYSCQSIKNYYSCLFTKISNQSGLDVPCPFNIFLIMVSSKYWWCLHFFWFSFFFKTTGTRYLDRAAMIHAIIYFFTRSLIPPSQLYSSI